MNPLRYYGWIALLMISTTLLAPPYCPDEQTLTMGGKIVTAWVVAVDQEPVEALQARLQEYAKKQYRVHLRPDAHNSELLMAKRAVMPSITYLEGSLMSRVYCQGDTTLLAVAYLPTSGIALNTRNNPQDMQNLWSFTRHFVKYYQVHRIQDQMEDEYRLRSDWEYSYEQDEREIRKLTQIVKRLEKQIARTEGLSRAKRQQKKAELEKRIAELHTLLAVKNREIARTYATLHRLKDELERIKLLFDEPVMYEWGPPVSLLI